MKQWSRIRVSWGRLIILTTFSVLAVSSCGKENATVEVKTSAQSTSERIIENKNKFGDDFSKILRGFYISHTGNGDVLRLFWTVPGDFHSSYEIEICHPFNDGFCTSYARVEAQADGETYQLSVDGTESSLEISGRMDQNNDRVVSFLEAFDRDLDQVIQDTLVLRFGPNVYDFAPMKPVFRIQAEGYPQKVENLR